MEEVSIGGVHTYSIEYKSYYVDGVPRVSIDGQSHGMLTLIMCVSGFFVASLVIIGVIMVMRYGKSEPRHIHIPDITTDETENDVDSRQRANKVRSSVFTIFGNSRQSFNVEHNV